MATADSDQPSGNRRAQRVRPSRRAPMTREEIVTEALALVDEQGVEALTMRALAERLTANTASIYWHAGGRDELLSAVLAQALAGLEPPDPQQPWRSELMRFAVDLRATFAEHPNFALLTVEAFALTPPLLVSIERILAALSGAGFAGEALRDAYNVYIGYAFGYVMLEFASTPVEDPTAWSAAVGRTLGEITPEHTPMLAAHFGELSDGAFGLRSRVTSQSSLGVSFHVGLEVVLDGLVARLRAAPPPDRPAR